MADGRLLAEPGAARALEGARAVVFLVGSYDGSGNYGDIAQYEAAAALVSALGPRVVPIAVVEDVYGLDHVHGYDGRGAGARGTVLAHFAAGTDPGSDDRIALALPPGVRAAAIYLYGGGYLNARWGERKLAMVDAVVDLLRLSGIRVGAPLASGQQIDAGWLDTLDADRTELLRSIRPFGVRDTESARALTELACSPVLTGDDAVGLLLGHMAPAPGAGRDGALRANVHISDWQWTTGDGDALLDFCAAVLDGLARPGGLRVQPVIAYDDRQTSEFPVVERFAAACRARGMDVTAFAEPLLLRPGTLDGELGHADLTLSCSYHVALTSLLLGVPAALVAENSYYAQKAGGLLEDFGLPPAFAPHPGQAPAEAAEQLLGALEDARASVAHGAERVAVRRLRAERDLLGALTDELVTALAETRAGAAASQVEPDAALELAQLQADHQALLRAELDARMRIAERDEQLGAERERVAEQLRLRQQTGRELAEAHRRAADLEQAVARAEAARHAAALHSVDLERRLADVVESRSWRLTSMARSAARRLRGS